MAPASGFDPASLQWDKLRNEQVRNFNIRDITSDQCFNSWTSPKAGEIMSPVCHSCASITIADTGNMCSTHNLTHLEELSATHQIAFHWVAVNEIFRPCSQAHWTREDAFEAAH